MAGADNGMECTHRKAIRDEEEMNRDVKRKALSETRTYSDLRGFSRVGRSEVTASRDRHAREP